MIAHFEKRDNARREASRLAKDASHTTESPTAIDPWGTEYRIEVEVNNSSRMAIATSAGPDRVFETNDDIQAFDVNLNKSRMFGRWIAKKAKEGAKGAVEGLKEESEFQEHP